jgi:hypothetical protein
MHFIFSYQTKRSHLNDRTEGAIVIIVVISSSVQCPRISVAICFSIGSARLYRLAKEQVVLVYSPKKGQLTYLPGERNRLKPSTGCIKLKTISEHAASRGGIR